MYQAPNLVLINPMKGLSIRALLWPCTQTKAQVQGTLAVTMARAHNNQQLAAKLEEVIGRWRGQGLGFGCELWGFGWLGCMVMA